MGISDSDLAAELIVRLNNLLDNAHPDVRSDIRVLLETRVRASQETENHPTIQIWAGDEEDEDGYRFGFLGLLNGIVGKQPNGTGHICAAFSESGELLNFRYVNGLEIDA